MQRFALLVSFGLAVALAAPARAADPAASWLASLSSPAAAPAIEFRVVREGNAPSGEPVRVAAPGDEIHWYFVNRSSGDLWVTVFAVGPAGASRVYPFRSRPEPIAPGKGVDQKGEVSLEAGQNESRDTLVLVATAEPLDAEALLDPARFPAGSEALEAAGFAAARHELLVRREIVEIATAPRAEIAPAPAAVVAPVPAQSVDAPVAPEGEVRTAPSPVSARPAPRRARRVPRITRFAVQYDAPIELGRVQRRLPKLRALCGRTGSACKVQRLPGSESVFELERTGRRLGEGENQTLARAFEQAYQIERGLEAARVEPLLELILSASGEDAARTMWERIRARRTTPPGPESLALFGSLGPATAGYGELFAGPGARDVERFEAELMHHYVVDAEVARGLDALAAGQGPVAAREALLRRGISRDLREALRPEDDAS